MDKMHRGLHAFLVVAALGVAGLLLGSFTPVFGSPVHERSGLQSALVSVDPPNVTVPVGAMVTVEIRITGVMDLDTMELYMTYDPAVVEIVDMRPGEPGVQIEIGPFLHPTAADVNFVDAVYGEIDFLQQAPGAPVDGSGVVARITARGKAPGTATIGFDAALLYDEEGIEISVRTEEGRIVVTEASGATATVSPSATFTSTPGLGTPTAEQSPSPTTALDVTPSPSATPETVGTSSPSPSPTMAGESPLETPAASVSPSPFPRLTPLPGEPDRRIFQIWPDRILDVSSGRVVTPALPSGQTAMFGVSAVPGVGAVHARTYFHFPMSVFPPGTDILQATLYVYADSATGEGKGLFGLYRVVADWTEQSGGVDPQEWPSLLPAPISLTEAQFDLLSPDDPRSGRELGGGQPPDADTHEAGSAPSSVRGVTSLQVQDVARLRFEPSVVEVAVGVSAVLSIYVEDVQDLESVDLVVRFDPEVLEVVDVDAGAAGVQIAPGPFLDGGTAETNAVTPDLGRIEFTQFAADPASGSGVLARITFRGKAGGASTVRFDRATLEDARGRALAIDEADAAISVVGGTPSASAGDVAQTPRPTGTPPTSPLPTPTVSAAATSLPPGTVPITLSEIVGTWVTWDATALLRAWWREEVPNQGLAVAAGPVADADPEEGGNVLAARWLTAGERRIQPFLIVHVEVRPVTPTPSPIFCLPDAGPPAYAGGGWSALVPVLVGVALLLLGLALQHRGG